MHSSGKTTRSAPALRARSIHSATLAELPSTSPTVGSIWASASRIGRERDSYPKYRRRQRPERAAAPVRWARMPERRRHLGGAWTAALLALLVLAAPAAAEPSLGDAVPSLASP